MAGMGKIAVAGIGDPLAEMMLGLGELILLAIGGPEV